MAISNTTFEQRVTRINKGLTEDEAARVGRGKKRQSFKKRCMTVPFLTGVGILTGLPAYAVVQTQPDMQWVIAEVQRVISLVA